MTITVHTVKQFSNLYINQDMILELYNTQQTKKAFNFHITCTCTYNIYIERERKDEI